MKMRAHSKVRANLPRLPASEFSCCCVTGRSAPEFPKRSFSVPSTLTKHQQQARRGSTR
jgi:hypothetical protein